MPLNTGSSTLDLFPDRSIGRPAMILVSSPGKQNQQNPNIGGTKPRIRGNVVGQTRKGADSRLDGRGCSAYIHRSHRGTHPNGDMPCGCTNPSKVETNSL